MTRANNIIMSKGGAWERIQIDFFLADANNQYEAKCNWSTKHWFFWVCEDNSVGICSTAALQKLHLNKKIKRIFFFCFVHVLCSKQTTYSMPQIVMLGICASSTKKREMVYLAPTQDIFYTWQIITRIGWPPFRSNLTIHLYNKVENFLE